MVNRISFVVTLFMIACASVLAGKLKLTLLDGTVVAGQLPEGLK